MNAKKKHWGTAVLLAVLSGMVITLPGCFLMPAQETFGNHIRHGQYQEAYDMVNPDHVGEGSSIGFKAMFDLVNVHVNGRDVDQLHCAPTYERFPNSHSYSMKLCGILHQYLDQGAVDEAKIEDLREFLRENYRDLRYLADAAADLNRLQP